MSEHLLSVQDLHTSFLPIPARSTPSTAFVQPRPRRGARHRGRVRLRQERDGLFHYADPGRYRPDNLRQHPLQGRRHHDMGRPADERLPRQVLLHRLPGPHDESQPRLYHRQPAARGHRAAHDRKGRAPLAARDRNAGACRHQRARKSVSSSIRTSCPAACASAS